MKNLRITISAILLTPLVLVSPACGQKVSTASPQLKPEAHEKKMAATEEQEHAIKVRVNEVIVPVTILDSKGEMIFDLMKDKFHIFDNGAEQTIEHFDLGGDPLAVALLIETSSHIQ